MQRTRLFQITSWAALAIAVAMAAVSVVVAVSGAVGLSGWKDYPERVQLVPFTDLATIDVRQGWEAQAYGETCPEVDLEARYPQGRTCWASFINETENDPVRSDTVRRSTGDLRPTEAAVRGTLYLDGEKGWHPLLASLYAMTALGWLVIAFVLLQLWQILRVCAAGEPFTDRAVRSLRIMGGTLMAWQVLEPLAWLFNSPKAHELATESFGPGPALQLSGMEPGADPEVFLFGLLLVLLASVFRHGAEIDAEQKLTV